MQENNYEFDVRWLGRVEYREAWALQDQLAAERLAGEIPDTLLLLEHPPTLTLGRGADAAHVLADPARLERMGVTILETNRGGDVTYHGPGQLVGYPILNLSVAPHSADLHIYLRNLEEVLIRALAEFQISATRFPGYTGVWTEMESENCRKIAAIGIRSSRWITQHGFALNVSTDLSHFDLIVPCGIRDYGVTSISKLIGKEVGVQEPIPAVVESFEAVFNMMRRSNK